MIKRLIWVRPNSHAYQAPYTSFTYSPAFTALMRIPYPNSNLVQTLILSLAHQCNGLTVRRGPKVDSMVRQRANVKPVRYGIGPIENWLVLVLCSARGEDFSLLRDLIHQDEVHPRDQIHPF